MQRIINTLAMMAAVVTLGTGIWQDWGLLSTVKRMILSYLGFFFLGAILAVAIMIIPHFEKNDDKAEKADAAPNGARKKS